MKAIADTGFLIAFINRGDTHHEWAVSLASQLTEPCLTCESVLSETAFHTDSRYVFDILREGLVKLAFNCEEHLPQLEELARRYANRKPDFADLCLIRMSELFPEHSVVTVDRQDFRIYRRNKREIIPLICPPEE
ncbi:MAG TPA: pilus assembly protein [Verrucomicrobiae bacterium]|nr:pilus assembly protein [Verrucomicrobiae bacterium]